MLFVVVAGILDSLSQLLIAFGLPALVFVVFLCGKKGGKKAEPNPKGGKPPPVKTGDSQEMTKSSEKRPRPQLASTTQPTKSTKSKDVTAKLEEKEEEKVEKEDEEKKERIMGTAKFAEEKESDGKAETKKKEEEKVEEKKKISESLYPAIQEPTESVKKKKKEEAAQDKQDKIAAGFYQAKSDEDDTLEEVQSLAAEQSTKGASSRRNKPKEP